MPEINFLEVEMIGARAWETAWEIAWKAPF